MKHRVLEEKLGRTSKHKELMLRNMLVSFLQSEFMNTTIVKAKVFRKLLEKTITLAKEDTVHTRRRVRQYINNKLVINKLFKEIAPRFKERPGGYTRIIRTSFRKGDNAPLCIIELVDRKVVKKEKKGKKEKQENKEKSVVAN